MATPGRPSKPLRAAKQDVGGGDEPGDDGNGVTRADLMVSIRDRILLHVRS